VIACEVASKERDELIALVNTDYEALGEALLAMRSAIEDARGTLEILMSAEIRLAVAMANVEDGGGDDDGGGEQESEAA
jgi:hypothetical protein